MEDGGQRLGVEVTKEIVEEGDRGGHSWVPGCQPGYQHVLKLANALLEARSLQGLSDKRVDELMALWQRLPESSTLPDTGRGSRRGGSRQRRGRTPPVLGRRVSNAVFLG
ncbi:hypothetical protein KUCAC02_009613 [Chaenocephalus aceratus]|nr:hypothetical protein KUCAC02_009613 [Chaenocephalus aceratus]